jgi:Fic family protein
LSRRALEALAADEYKHERITKPEPQRLLGIETSFQLDEFLKAHDVWIEYTREDAARERRGLERLGF